MSSASVYRMFAGEAAWTFPAFETLLDVLVETSRSVLDSEADSFKHHVVSSFFEQRNWVDDVMDLSELPDSLFMHYEIRAVQRFYRGRFLPALRRARYVRYYGESLPVFLFDKAMLDDHIRALSEEGNRRALMAYKHLVNLIRSDLIRPKLQGEPRWTFYISKAGILEIFKTSRSWGKVGTERVDCWIDYLDEILIDKAECRLIIIDDSYFIATDFVRRNYLAAYSDDLNIGNELLVHLSHKWANVYWGRSIPKWEEIPKQYSIHEPSSSDFLACLDDLRRQADL